MIKTIKKDSSTYPIVFFMADSSDHVTAKTGLTPTVTLSKNGGSFASASGAVSEIANGFYKIAGNATDSNTVGPLIVHAEASGADPADLLFSVANHDPYQVAEPGDEMLLTSAYDAAKTASQAGDAMTLTSAYDASKTASQAGDEMLLTSAYDAAKTASQAGDAMTLTAAYDASKTASQAGDEMLLTSAYDAAKTASQAGDAMTLTAAYDASKTASQAGDAMTLTSAYDNAKDDVLTPLAVVDANVDSIKSTVDTNLDMAITDINFAGAVAVSVTEALSAATGEMSLSVYYTFDRDVTTDTSEALDTATKLWFAIKDIDETDANSLIFVEATDGLTIVDKTAYGTAAHGTITVTGSSGDWTISIMVDEAATTLLSAYDNQYYYASLKAIVGGDALHIWDGRCKITNGVIRSVS